MNRYNDRDMYTKQLIHAASLAYEAHEGQMDKAGKPYFGHPLAVATKVADLGYPENYVIVAFLHDVLEDTSIDEDDIEMAGFSNEVIEALRLLSRDKKVPYMDYIKRLKDNDIARVVKLADLTHNMEISRIPDPKEKDIKLHQKYEAAYDYLLTDDDIRARVAAAAAECEVPMEAIDQEEFDGIAEQIIMEDKGLFILDGYHESLCRKGWELQFSRQNKE